MYKILVYVNHIHVVFHLANTLACALDPIIQDELPRLFFFYNEYLPFSINRLSVFGFKMRI